MDDLLESDDFRVLLRAYMETESQRVKRIFSEAITDFIREHCAPKWQPIDTAPKDSTVLLFRPDAAYWAKVSIGAWEEDTFAKRPKPYWEGLHKLGSVSQYRAWEPTHWMPLPDALKVEE